MDLIRTAVNFLPEPLRGLLTQFISFSPSTQILLFTVSLSFLVPLIYIGLGLFRLFKLVLSPVINAVRLLTERKARRRGSDAGSDEGHRASSPAAAPSSSAPQKGKGKSIRTLLAETRELGRSAAQASDERAGADPLFLSTLKGHGGSVLSVRWSPEGTYIATSADDGRVRAYDVSGEFKRALTFAAERRARGEAAGAVLGPGKGQVIALINDGSASLASLTGSPTPLWEVAPVLKKEAGKVLCGGYPPADRWGDVRGQAVAAVGGSGTSIAIVQAATGKLLATVDTCQVQNHGLAMTRDGRYFAAPAWTSDVKVWELKFHREAGGVGAAAFVSCNKAYDLTHKKGTLAVAFSHELPAPKRAVTSCKDGTIVFWNTDIRYNMREDPKILRTIASPLPNSAPYDHVALSPGPGYIIAASCGQAVHLFAAATGDVIAEIPFAHVRVTDLTFCPEMRAVPGEVDPRAVLATSGTDKRARLWMMPKVSGQ